MARSSQAPGTVKVRRPDAAPPGSLGETYREYVWAEETSRSGSDRPLPCRRPTPQSAILPRATRAGVAPAARRRSPSGASVRPWGRCLTGLCVLLVLPLPLDASRRSVVAASRAPDRPAPPRPSRSRSTSCERGPSSRVPSAKSAERLLLARRARSRAATIAYVRLIESPAAPRSRARRRNVRHITVWRSSAPIRRGCTQVGHRPLIRAP